MYPEPTLAHIIAICAYALFLYWFTIKGSDLLITLIIKAVRKLRDCLAGNNRKEK